MASLFKRFFSKENATDHSVASPVKPKEEMMEEGGGGVGDAGKEFWKNLNLARGKNKCYRRLKDMVNQMPEHVVNRIRQIDHQLAMVLTTSHKLVSLLIHEVLNQNTDNPLMFEGSREWDDWFEPFERRCMAFRKVTVEDLKELLSKLKYKEKDVSRLNSLIKAKPGELEQLTGLDRIEDLKSNLIDIAVLLGKDSESKLTNTITEEPVRNIIDSFEYNLDFFEKMMGNSCSRLRADIEKCWKVLSTGSSEAEADLAKGQTTVGRNDASKNLKI